MTQMSANRLANFIRGPVGLSIVLLFYNNAVSFAPQAARSRFLVFANLALLAVLLYESLRVSRLSLSQLGLGRANLWPSAAFGIFVAFALATVPVAFIVVAPALTGEPIEYADVNDLSTGELMYRVAVSVPIGTALFEEIAFRGILYAKFQSLTGDRQALFYTSVVFGLWHVVITSRTVVESDVVDNPFLVPPAILVGLAGTFVGGLVFGWLRWRTRHVAGPFVVHWLTVAAMSLAVWLRA